MWINNTFVRVKGKNGEWRVLRGKGFLVPQYHRARQRENVVALEESAMQGNAVCLACGFCVVHWLCRALISFALYS